MDEAEHCHRLGFIQQGRLVALGTPDDLKQNAMPGKVIELECTQTNLALSILQDSNLFHDVSLYGALIHIVSTDAETQILLINHLLNQSSIEISEISIISPSLEDVFITSARSYSHSRGELP